MVYLLISILSFVSSSDSSRSIPPAEDYFKAFKQQISSGNHFSARFSMQWINAQGNTEQQAFGTLVLWKDGYRIDSDQNERVVFQQLSEVIDHQQQQYIISDYIAEDDDFAPAKILQEDYLSAFEQDSPTPNTINWRTEDPFETFRRLRIRFENALPGEIEAYDQLDNRILLFLDEMKWVEVDSNLYHIDIPSDYRKIDLRNE